MLCYFLCELCWSWIIFLDNEGVRTCGGLPDEHGVSELWICQQSPSICTIVVVPAKESFCSFPLTPAYPGMTMNVMFRVLEFSSKSSHYLQKSYLIEFCEAWFATPVIVELLSQLHHQIACGLLQMCCCAPLLFCHSFVLRRPNSHVKLASGRDHTWKRPLTDLSIMSM